MKKKDVFAFVVFVFVTIVVVGLIDGYFANFGRPYTELDSSAKLDNTSTVEVNVLQHFWPSSRGMVIYSYRPAENKESMRIFTGGGSDGMFYFRSVGGHVQFIAKTEGKEEFFFSCFEHEREACPDPMFVKAGEAFDAMKRRIRADELVKEKLGR